MKNILMISALAGSLLAAAAHTGTASPPSEEERAQRLERMQVHLQLSDEQVAQIQQIRADGGGRDEIRAVLSEDQQAKLDEARKRHGGKHNGPAPTEDE